jgi:hypothetical protein
MLTDETKVHLEASLAHLEREHDAVLQEVKDRQGRLRELAYTIATLSKEIGRIPAQPTAPVIHPTVSHQTTMTCDPSRKYANISVRWAILHLLSEKEPMTTSDIADALKTCGVTTRAANFTNNVSAVLSTTMKGDGKVEGEVEVLDGKWRLTATGRSAIDHIKVGPKFKASCPWVDAPGVTASIAPVQLDRRP